MGYFFLRERLPLDTLGEPENVYSFQPQITRYSHHLQTRGSFVIFKALLPTVPLLIVPTTLRIRKWKQKTPGINTRAFGNMS